MKTKFCPKGHDKDIVGRTQTGGCKLCNVQRTKTWNEQHPQEVKERQEHWNNENPDYHKKRYKKNRKRILRINKKWKDENKDRIRETKKQWNEKNPDYQHNWYEENKEEIIKRCREYYNKNAKLIYKKNKKYRQEHPEIAIKSRIKSKTNRALRIPPWADWDAIIQFYKKCPKNKTVDHVIPLCGRKVSGLHVSWNLQYLTLRQNSKKHNKVNLKEISINYGKLLKKLGLK